MKLGDMKTTPDSGEIIVGLDIGTTKIACLVGRKDENGKVTILGRGKSDSVGVSRGVVANIEKTVRSIKEAVKMAEEDANVSIKVVNVGIAGQHIKSLQHRGQRMRNSHDDEISQADIDAMILDMNRISMQPGEEILHVLPQEFTVDNEQGIKDPIGMSGIRLEANFHIITGQIAAIKNIYKCVSKAGLEVAQLFLEPLASSEAVLSEEEKEAGVALVDIGGGTTDIAIFQDGIIRHTAVIPFGGNVITEDIRIGCTILRSQAEQLKTRFGSAISEESQMKDVVCIPGLRGREAKEIPIKTLARIIQARMEEILDQVHYEIKVSGYEKHLIAGIVVTGGGAMMRHLPQLIEYATGMDCRIGYPNEHISQAPSNDITSPAYATGIGLVIKGFERKITSTEPVIEKKDPRIEGEKGPIKILQRLKEWFESEDID
jgi:cell division protein FtsA